MLESKLSGRKEKKIICVNVVVEGKRRDKSTERCGVHDEE